MKVSIYSLLLIILNLAILLPVTAQVKSMEESMAAAKEEASKKKMTKPLKIAFYLQDGVEVLDFAGPLEVFAVAGFDIMVVSKTKSPIISEGVLKIIPDYSIDNAPAADIVAIFGGQDINDSSVLNWLKNMSAPKIYFSVCSGALTLGKAGLLDNLSVTTHHQRIDELKQVVPKAKVLSNVRYVDNGSVITTAGISAGIDGALHIVAKLKGEKMAMKIAEYMEYDKWVPDQGLVISADTAINKR